MFRSLKGCFVALCAMVAVSSANAGALIPWNFQGSSASGSPVSMNMFGEFQTDGDATSSPVLMQMVSGFWNGAQVVGVDVGTANTHFSYDNKLTAAAPFFQGGFLLQLVNQQDAANVLDGMIWTGHIANLLYQSYYDVDSNQLVSYEINFSAQHEAITKNVPEPASLPLVATLLLILASLHVRLNASAKRQESSR